MDQRDPKLLSSKVLSIDCERGPSTRWEEGMTDRIRKGNIVDELKIRAGGDSYKAPAKFGRSSIQKLLRHAYRSTDKSVLVRVKRNTAEIVELQAEVMLDQASTSRKQNYVLKSISNPSFVFSLVERTLGDCLDLQGYGAKLQDGFRPYSWDRRMHELLPLRNSSTFFSILLFPREVDLPASRYHDLEDTLARAQTWLEASQISGVPICCVNIQTEPMLTKISGETASPTVNAGPLIDLTGVSLYGFEDYHGVDIGILRPVRLWYAPSGAEVALDIKPRDCERLGFAIDCTEEGFIHIKSVEDDDSQTWIRKLRHLHREAQRAMKLLVVSRVSNEKVLPSVIAPKGSIRCVGIESIRSKLSTLQAARESLSLHVFASSPSSTAENSFLRQPLFPSGRSTTLSDARLGRHQNQDAEAGGILDGSSADTSSTDELSFSFSSLPL